MVTVVIATNDHLGSILYSFDSVVSVVIAPRTVTSSGGSGTVGRAVQEQGDPTEREEMESHPPAAEGPHSGRVCAGEARGGEEHTAGLPAH